MCVFQLPNRLPLTTSALTNFRSNFSEEIEKQKCGKTNSSTCRTVTTAQTGHSHNEFCTKILSSSNEVSRL